MSVPLRLLYGLNADGKPKRISMFPPSYSDRARAREAKRRGRVAGSSSSSGAPPPSPLYNPSMTYLLPASPHLPLNPESSKPRSLRLGDVIIEKGRIVVPRNGRSGNRDNENGKTVGYLDRSGKVVDRAHENGTSGSPGNFVGPSKLNEERVPRSSSASAAAQTDLTYCTHECGSHPRTKAPNTAKEHTQKGKKEKSAKEPKDAPMKSDGGKANKQEKGNAKSAQHSETHHDDSSDSDSSSAEDDSSNKNKSRKEPQAKKQAQQTRSGKRGDTDLWDPSSLPFLTSLMPGLDKLSKQEKQVVEQYTRQTRESIASARQADEEEARRWCTQQLAATHSGALRWLRERDMQRQAAAANSVLFDPADLLAALNEAEARKRKVPRTTLRGPPILTATPDPNSPLWSSDEQPHHPHGVRFANGLAPAPFATFQDSSHGFTPNGQPVPTVQNIGGPVQGRPLQTISGNTQGRNSAGGPQNVTANSKPQGPPGGAATWQWNSNPVRKSASVQWTRPQSDGNEWANTQNAGGAQMQRQDSWVQINHGGPSNDQDWVDGNNNNQDGWSKNDQSGWVQPSGDWATASNQDAAWEENDMLNGEENQNSGQMFDPATGISFHPPEQAAAAPHANW